MDGHRHDDGRFGRNFRRSGQKEDHLRETGIQCPELPERANTQPAPDSEKAFGEVKMKTSRKNNECPDRHSFCENLWQCLGEFWQDLREHSAWKYEDFPHPNYWRNLRFIGIRPSKMSSPAPIGFGVAGRTGFLQSAGFFGLLSL